MSKLIEPLPKDKRRQDRFISNGVKYTDSIFDEIIGRLKKAGLKSDSLKDFLDRTKQYTIENPLISTEYSDKILDLILSETKYHKFSSNVQEELTRQTITDRVGELIKSRGESFREDIKTLMSDFYNNKSSIHDLTLDVENKLVITEEIENVGSNHRAKAKQIVRTELHRTAVISDYIINKEAGAKSFTIVCDQNACPYCKEKAIKGYDKSKYSQKTETITVNQHRKNPETGELEDTGRVAYKETRLKVTDENTPPETTATGSWKGDLRYGIEDTEMLPSYHPNCRCSVRYSMEAPNAVSTTITETPVDDSKIDVFTPEEFEKLSKIDQSRYTKAVQSASNNMTKLLIESEPKKIEGAKNKLNKNISVIEEMKAKVGKVESKPKVKSKPKIKMPDDS